MARRPQRSTGRSLIGGGVGIVIFAVALWFLLPAVETPTSSARFLGSVVFAIVGVPIGVVGIVVGILRIRRGER